MNNMHPLDGLIIALLALVIMLSLIAVKEACKLIMHHYKVHIEVEQLYKATWTGHAETRLYACNVVYQKLGGHRMKPAYKKAFKRLTNTVLKPAQAGKRPIKPSQPEKLILIQKPSL